MRKRAEKIFPGGNFHNCTSLRIMDILYKITRQTPSISCSESKITNKRAQKIECVFFHLAKLAEYKGIEQIYCQTSVNK